MARGALIMGRPGSGRLPGWEQRCAAASERQRCWGKIPLTSAARDATLRRNLTGRRYMGEVYGKRVRLPHGRATVIGDESQQDQPLAHRLLGRRWRVG
jgi:hypothetical protein